MTDAANSPFKIDIPLTKIDHARRMVIGVAALEQPDLAKEIMDYDSAKGAFESWSKGFEDATNGLSKGNLRVMHTKTVAGRLDQIAFNDDAKRIEVCAKVTDENEWQKVLDGNYTGFSVGGGYAKKWKDGDLTRYTPRVAELSLVDSPCMPGARFAELLKADGLVEQVELHGRLGSPSESFGSLWKRRPAPVPTFADAWASRPLTFGDLMKADGASGQKQNGGFVHNVGKATIMAGSALGGAIGGSAAYHFAKARQHYKVYEKHARLAGVYGSAAASSWRNGHDKMASAFSDLHEKHASLAQHHLDLSEFHQNKYASGSVGRGISAGFKFLSSHREA